MNERIEGWPKTGGTIRDMRRLITEDWLIANGFRIEDGRNDSRLPVRSLMLGNDLLRGRPYLASPDALCIDVAPTDSKRQEWYVWIARREPYRFIHVRYMVETWELVRLYEALTGRVWPGTL